jgi:hypothetical protein
VGEEMPLGEAPDLDHATCLAADMVGSLGLAEPTSLTYFGPRGSARDFLRFGEVRQAIARSVARFSNKPPPP